MTPKQELRRRNGAGADVSKWKTPYLQEPGNGALRRESGRTGLSVGKVIIDKRCLVDLNNCNGEPTNLEKKADKDLEAWGEIHSTLDKNAQNGTKIGGNRKRAKTAKPIRLAQLPYLQARWDSKNGL